MCNQLVLGNRHLLISMDEGYIQEILEHHSAKAYEKLIEKYQNRVFTLCYRIIKNREEAEEVAQDVFMKSFRELGKLKDPKKFPNWLMKITYTKAIDRTRIKSVSISEINKVKEEVLKEERTPLEETIIQDRKQIMKKAIGRLEKTEASLITLYYLEDLPVKEIAEIVEMTISNVKVKLFRARKNLKSIIAALTKTDLKDFIE